MTSNLQLFSEIISSLVHLGDQYLEMREQIRQRGFVSVDAITLRLDSLAQDENELDLHRRITMEKGKERFGDAFNATFELIDGDAYRPPYRSALLDAIRQDRQRTWESQANSDEEAKQIWLEPDPCQKKWLEMRFDEKKKMLVAWRDEFFRLREAEVVNKLPAPHKRLRPYNAEAKALAFAVFQDAIAPLGFALNKKISSKSFTLFTKPLIGEWVLCMTFRQSEWGFDQYSYETVEGKKRMNPQSADFHLDLRRQNKKGFVNKDFDFLPLNIAEMTPLGQFDFSWYLDADDMAIGILGYVEMYSIWADEIESTLKEVLARHGV